jgi:hypothetical protein
LEGGPPTFRQGFSCPALLKDMDPGFPYGAVTRSGPPFQTLPVPKTHATGLVRVRSPLLTESRLMSFPPATEMFQFAGFASAPYGLRCGYPLRGGLPHSETPGSPIARISPGLFAACYVLHRLSVPRHPPDALLMRLPTPNGKDPAGTRSQAPGFRIVPSPSTVLLAGARQTRLSEDTSCGRTTAPSGASAVPRGHTTRFFTIVHQQRRPAATRGRRFPILLPRRRCPDCRLLITHR